MRNTLIAFTVVFAVIVSACPALSFDGRAYQIREDFGMESLEDCYLNYYYYIPCPTYSWFWSFEGWEQDDIVGAFFQVGDISMATGTACDPDECHTLDMFRVLDFTGYGIPYPSHHEVEFDIYCCDEYGCPVGPSLWSMGPWKTGFGWNYISVDPPLSICDCSVIPGGEPSAPRVLITAKHVGRHHFYPEWGTDNVSSNLEAGCEMHDISCLSSIYPRPYNSYYTTMHSGFYGQDFTYCPPQWFKDGRDTTPDATDYGYIELAWRIYLTCYGPSETEPATWGNIKSMYR